MSQAVVSPANMVRIEKQVEEIIRNLGSLEGARKLLSDGYIDITWASEHTRTKDEASDDGA